MSTDLTRASTSVMLNIISIDVEDYFHPAEVSRDSGPSHWRDYRSRVDVGLNLIMNMLAETQTLGTFFILGWVAEQHPSLIRRIAEAGHEIGCHSYEHRLVYRLTPQQFKSDTVRAIRAIEDACGIRPRAYRAPSYSITTQSLWALDVLIECGFTHDSSIYPIRHDRYGIPGFSRHATAIKTAAGAIIEVPVATVRILDGVAPIGGGGYLRILPYRYTAAGIRRLNRDEGQPACIYTHPWELDTGQPRLATGLVSRMRTYAGLDTVATKLKRMLRDFRFAPLAQVHPLRSTTCKSEAV